MYFREGNDFRIYNHVYMVVGWEYGLERVMIKVIMLHVCVNRMFLFK